MKCQKECRHLIPNERETCINYGVLVVLNQAVKQVERLVSLYINLKINKLNGEDLVDSKPSMGRSLFLPLLSKLVTIKMHTIKVITTITSIFASSGRLSKYQEATLFESMHDVIIIISLTSLNCFAKTLASIVRSSFLQHDQATR